MIPRTRASPPPRSESLDEPNVERADGASATPADRSRPATPSGAPNRDFDRRQSDADDVAARATAGARGADRDPAARPAPPRTTPPATTTGVGPAPHDGPPARDGTPARDGNASRPEEPRAPGLKDQVGNTKGAVGRLISAHVNLAKAEVGEVLDEVKRVAVLAGVALGALILVGLLLAIGLMLFLGEALFGSLGWGVLHGALLFVGIAMAAVLIALGLPRGAVTRGLVIGAVLGIVVGLILGLDLTNRLWTAVGSAIAGQFSADIRPLIVGAGILAILGALLGLVLGGRRGGASGAIGGLVLGAILGALLGVLTSIALGPRVGAAIGVTVALITWLAMMGRAVAREGVDADALKARFWPQQTVDTAKETIEWVREQTPLGPKS